jgi:hypothetical protein
MDDYSDADIERAAAAAWDLTASIKWADPLMKPEWKPFYIAQMRAALAVLHG